MRSSVDVHNALIERGIPHELVPIRGRMRKPDRIAAVFGLDPAQVGRVILYEGEGRLVAALLSAAHKPDPKRVAAAAGLTRAREVRAARTSQITGYLPEALPPVALPPEVGLLMDVGLSNGDVLYFPGGEASSVLKIRGPDLVRATGATIAPLTRES
jgi:Cys-tRNA(Pro)/Cys-tRNA(Cys) deacylase